MKKVKLFLLICTIIIGLFSCKAFAKGAAKWWTKKQIKEFVYNCERKSTKLLGEKSAKKFCDCAVDEVAEKYHDFDDMRRAGMIKVLKIAKNCR